MPLVLSLCCSVHTVRQCAWQISMFRFPQIASSLDRDMAIRMVICITLHLKLCVAARNMYIGYGLETKVAAYTSD